MVQFCLHRQCCHYQFRGDSRQDDVVVDNEVMRLQFHPMGLGERTSLTISALNVGGQQSQGNEDRVGVDELHHAYLDEWVGQLIVVDFVDDLG